MAYIYVVRCEDNSLYCGIARDVYKRISDHFNKKKTAAKYTKSHPVKSVCGVWETAEWSDAARFEFAFKKIPKNMKETILMSPNTAISACNLILHGELDESLFTTIEGVTLEECLKRAAQNEASGEG